METFKKSMTNTVFDKTFRQAATSTLNRKDILKNYSYDIIECCWDSFCKLIAQNYQTGKGTIIPKFGTFTFNNAEVSLEGTTNQYARDLKARKPVFLVSSDFLDNLNPGIFSSGGLIYYTQKMNNNIGHVKINHAELAYSLNIKKEDYFVIIDNLLKNIADTIIKVIIFKLE
jgi:hypothetical protein